MQYYTIPPSAMDVQDPVPAPPSPFPRSRKGKKIPRPPNAFLLFRSWLIQSGKLPSGVGNRQQDISKISGKAWNMLDESEKLWWRQVAADRLRDFEAEHPNYKFEPSPKSRRTAIGKVRKANDDSDDDTAMRLKALSDVYARDHRAAAPTTPKRARQRTSPYKVPTKQRTPQTPVRRPKTTQSTTGSQPGSPTMPLLSFDSPPSSPQPPSPLSLHHQPPFAQGAPQHEFPYMFLPPGLPNHFEQAHQQEDGVRLSTILASIHHELTNFFQTIVFADNYAPVNPFSPPPGYYIFSHARSAPVEDAGGMMTGTVPDTTAAMLNLYELNSPYAHYNPNLDAGGSDSPVPPTTDPLSILLSTAPLTAQEQQVFDAIIGDTTLPLTLEHLIPFPLSAYQDESAPAMDSVAVPPSLAVPSSPSPLSTSVLPELLSFTQPLKRAGKEEKPISKMPRSPATKRHA